MGNVLWTYEHSGVYWSIMNPFRLVVVPATMQGQFRFQVLRRVAVPSTYVSLSSGHRPELKDAMEAVVEVAMLLEAVH